MAREKVLLVGDTSVSKSMNLILLTLLYPDKKILIFDPEDGVNKVLHELGFIDTPANLTIFRVKPDWTEMMTFYDAVKGMYQEGDWVCPDMLGKFWDLAQQYYSVRVFGQNPIEHLLTLRSQAQKTNFGGFDGLQDWSLIKRMHNELFIDDMVINSPFNVMATTSANQFLPIEKIPNPEQDQVGNLLALKFGVKPEGEKHNTFRFDTIILVRRTRDNRFVYNIVKDKGRAFNPDTAFEFTNPKMLNGTWTVLDLPTVKSVWSTYLDNHQSLRTGG
jgi:hypothetical protein